MKAKRPKKFPKGHMPKTAKSLLSQKQKKIIA